MVLAGYMRLVAPPSSRAFPWRVINLHPALLPAFPGTTSISDAVRYGVKVTGVTVHFVDEGVDTGPVIAQEAVRVKDGDTAESWRPASTPWSIGCCRRPSGSSRPARSDRRFRDPGWSR